MNRLLLLALAVLPLLLSSFELRDDKHLLGTADRALKSTENEESAAEPGTGEAEGAAEFGRLGAPEGEEEGEYAESGNGHQIIVCRVGMLLIIAMKCFKVRLEHVKEAKEVWKLYKVRSILINWGIVYAIGVEFLDVAVSGLAQAGHLSVGGAVTVYIRRLSYASTFFVLFGILVTAMRSRKLIWAARVILLGLIVGWFWRPLPISTAGEIDWSNAIMAIAIMIVLSMLLLTKGCAENPWLFSCIFTVLAIAMLIVAVLPGTSLNIAAVEAMMLLKSLTLEPLLEQTYEQMEELLHYEESNKKEEEEEGTELVQGSSV